MPPTTSDIQRCHPAAALRCCPFCGSDGFLWDGAKSHGCAACGMRLYTNSAAAVAAIIENHDGDLLLVRRRYAPARGLLDLPGGFVDLDETAENAIVREVKEETALEVTSMRFWKTFSNRYVYGGVLYFTTDLVYICSVKDFAAMRAADDAAACILLPKREIDISRIGLMSIKKVVGEYIAGQI